MGHVGQVGLIRGHRDFRRLWIGGSISQLGTQISTLGVPLLAAGRLHASTWSMGLLAACQNAAFLLIGLPAGAWCDRVRRRPLMIAADFGRGAALAAVPVLAGFGALRMGDLFVLVFLVGVLTVFFDVSDQSYLPGLIGRDRLVEGNSALEASRTTAYTLGPTLAGYAVQLLGAPVALLADAASFFWSGAWIASIRVREPTPPRGERRLMREIGDGLRFVSRQPTLRILAVYTSATTLLVSADYAILILFLVRTLRISAGIIGIVDSCAGVGAITGAFAAGRIRRRLGSTRALPAAALVGGTGGLLIPLAQRGAGLCLFVAGSGLLSFGIVVFNITAVSYRQALCPDHLLSRMNATMRFMSWGVSPLGALLGGYLGTRFGLRTTMWITAAGIHFSGLWLAARQIHLNKTSVGALP
jgi:MFS family permease